MRSLMIVVLVAFATLGMSSCFDPPPGEISMRTVKNGKPQVCGVQLFASNGKQIQQVTSDMNGVVYIKKLKPGKYTIKFIDTSDKLYPAIRDVTVRPDDSVWLDEVELTKGPAEGTV